MSYLSRSLFIASRSSVEMIELALYQKIQLIFQKISLCYSKKPVIVDCFIRCFVYVNESKMTSLAFI